MKIKVFAVAILSAFISIFISSTFATAMDIPVLTWERGKEQNIVLGGNSQSKWNLELVDSKDQSVRAFTSSLPNAAGFVVYSITLPNDLTLGSYKLMAKGSDGTSNLVSGVEIIERKYFAITQIPTDLRLIFLIYALFTVTFSIIRGRRYSYLAFPRYKRFKSEEEGSGPKVIGFIQLLYKFRLRRQLGMEMSFLRFVTLRDGEPLHKLSANLWATLPVVTFLIGIFEATMMQGHKVIPHMSLPFYIGLAIIGGLDAASGFTAFIGFFAAQILFGDISSMRSVLTIFSFTMPWFAPSMLASIYYLTLRIDYFDYVRRFGSKVKMGMTLLFSSLFGASSVIFSTVVMESLLINQKASAFLRWPLASIVAVSLLIKNLMNELIDMRVIKKRSQVEMEIESIYVARVMSPSFASMIGFATVGLIYVWTQQLMTSLVAALVLVLPYLMLFVILPEFAGRKLPTFPRNITLEALLMVGITAGVFFGIEKLPMANFAKSKAFILLGVIPLAIHGLYSLIVDSSERAKKKDLTKGDVNA